MASLEARYLSLLRSKGLKAPSGPIPRKGVQRDIFSLLLSTAEKGRASEMDVFRLSSLLRRHLEGHSSSLSGKTIGILRRRDLYSALTGLISAADASLASYSFGPLVSKRRLAFSCISKVRDRDACVFLEHSFSDVFSIPSSKPLRDPSFYLAMDRILGILPVSISRVRFSDVLLIFVFAFLSNCVLLFSFSGAGFDETVRVLALMNLGIIYFGVSDLLLPRQGDDLPGLYTRLDILISKGIEPKVLDGVMGSVFDSVQRSKDPAGWTRSFISLLRGYKTKAGTKEADVVVEKWIKVFLGYKPPD